MVSSIFSGGAVEQAVRVGKVPADRAHCTMLLLGIIPPVAPIHAPILPHPPFKFDKFASPSLAIYLIGPSYMLMHMPRSTPEARLK